MAGENARSPVRAGQERRAIKEWFRPYRPEKNSIHRLPGPALVGLASAQAVTWRAFSPREEFQCGCRRRGDETMINPLTSRPLSPDDMARTVGAWRFVRPDDMGRCPMLVWQRAVGPRQRQRRGFIPGLKARHVTAEENAPSILSRPCQGGRCLCNQVDGCLPSCFCGGSGKSSKRIPRKDNYAEETQSQ